MEISDIKQNDNETSGGMIGINLGVGCNQNCTFCLASNGRDEFPALKKEEALSAVKNYLDQGYGKQTIMFTGGEPTINPDFLEIIKGTLEDPRVGDINLMTNGTKLSGDLFDKIMEIDKDRKISFSFSLHAPNPELAQQIVRDDGTGFFNTCESMRRAIDNGRITDVAIIIVEQNYKILPEYARFVAEKFPKISGVSFGYPILCGNAQINKDWIYAKFSNIGPYLSEAVKILNDAGIRTVTAAGAPFPLCSVPGMEEIIVRPSIVWQKNYIGTATNGHLSEYRHEDKRLPKEKPPICDKCVLKSACIGLYSSYIERFGADGADPIRWENFKGPKFETDKIGDILDQLDNIKLNLVISKEDSPGMYCFDEQKIAVVIEPPKAE